MLKRIWRYPKWGVLSFIVHCRVLLTQRQTNWAKCALSSVGYLVPLWTSRSRFNSRPGINQPTTNDENSLHKTIIPVLFSSVVRPIIGLAQLYYRAALQPRRYPVGCVKFIMGSEPGCATNSRRWSLVGWLVARYGNRTQDLWTVLSGFINLTPNQLS